MKLIIFDFDGTLVYLNIDYNGMRESLKDYFRKHGINSEFRPLIPSVNRAVLQLEKKLGKSVIDEVFDIIDEFEKEGTDKCVVFPNAKEVLQKLKEMGFKVGIFSNNGEKCIYSVLEKIGAKDMVDMVFSRDKIKDGMNIKPAEDGILEMMKKLKAKKEEAWMVGDRIYDEIAAKAVGIKFIAVKTKYSECDFQNPDFVVTDLKEILKIVK